MQNYVRVKKLGEGAFGQVYLVRHRPTNALYVMKEVDMSKLDSKGKEEAVREADFLKRLKHPNIIGYHDYFVISSVQQIRLGQIRNEKLYIVMQYADGGDLESKIKARRGQLFTENEVLDWFVQLALALKHIHDRKILHRDIKSQNVFLTKGNIAKLGDFGIAKSLDSTHSKAQTMIGTPYYLSPEICRESAYDNKSDMWSLGVVLYELMCLSHPFQAQNMKDLLNKICYAKYTPPTSQVYSSDLRGLLDKLLSKDPKDRPSINALLRLGFIRSRIGKFLSENTMQEEFSHTVIHAAGALLRRPSLPANHPPPPSSSSTSSSSSSSTPSISSATPSSVSSNSPSPSDTRTPSPITCDNNRDNRGNNSSNTNNSRPSSPMNGAFAGAFADAAKDLRRAQHNANHNHVGVNIPPPHPHLPVIARVGQPRNNINNLHRQAPFALHYDNNTNNTNGSSNNNSKNNNNNNNNNNNINNNNPIEKRKNDALAEQVELLARKKEEIKRLAQAQRQAEAENRRRAMDVLRHRQDNRNQCKIRPKIQEDDSNNIKKSDNPNNNNSSNNNHSNNDNNEAEARRLQFRAMRAEFLRNKKRAENELHGWGGSEGDLEHAMAEGESGGAESNNDRNGKSRERGAAGGNDNIVIFEGPKVKQKSEHDTNADPVIGKRPWQGPLDSTADIYRYPNDGNPNRNVYNNYNGNIHNNETSETQDGCLGRPLSHEDKLAIAREEAKKERIALQQRARLIKLMDRGIIDYDDDVLSGKKPLSQIHYHALGIVVPPVTPPILSQPQQSPSRPVSTSLSSPSPSLSPSPSPTSSPSGFVPASSLTHEEMLERARLENLAERKALMAKKELYLRGNWLGQTSDSKNDDDTNSCSIGISNNSNTCVNNGGGDYQDTTSQIANPSPSSPSDFSVPLYTTSSSTLGSEHDEFVQAQLDYIARRKAAKSSVLPTSSSPSPPFSALPPLPSSSHHPLSSSPDSHETNLSDANESKAGDADIDNDVDNDSEHQLREFGKEALDLLMMFANMRAALENTDDDDDNDIPWYASISAALNSLDKKVTQDNIDKISSSRDNTSTPINMSNKNSNRSSDSGSSDLIIDGSIPDPNALPSSAPFPKRVTGVLDVHADYHPTAKKSDEENSDRPSLHHQSADVLLTNAYFHDMKFKDPSTHKVVASVDSDGYVIDNRGNVIGQLTSKPRRVKRSPPTLPVPTPPTSSSTTTTNIDHDSSAKHIDNADIVPPIIVPSRSDSLTDVSDQAINHKQTEQKTDQHDVGMGNEPNDDDAVNEDPYLSFVDDDVLAYKKHKLGTPTVSGNSNEVEMGGNIGDEEDEVSVELLTSLSLGKDNPDDIRSKVSTKARPFLDDSFDDSFLYVSAVTNDE